MSLKLNLDKHLKYIKRWTVNEDSAGMALYTFIALALTFANAVASQQCAEPTAGAQVSSLLIDLTRTVTISELPHLYFS